MHCQECQKLLTNKSRKFCSQSCSAIFNNKKRSIASRQRQRDTMRQKYNTTEANCIVCNKIFKRRSKAANKYCSIQCQHEREDQIKFEQVELGLVTRSVTLKRYLTHNYGYKCVECDVTQWNNKPITLQLDHIDGNSDNCLPNNLRLLCPNCHSQTSTFSRNKNKQHKMTKRNVNIRETYRKGRWRS